MTSHPSGEHVGILNVCKPAGWTSHDVVARVRRLAGQKRVGHAGTLDPMAEGVLPILLGRATRLADYLHAGTKSYAATVALGVSTTTDDAEGEVVEQRPIPQLDARVLEDALDRFRGEIEQVPPQYSAVQVGGQRSYAVARKGGSLALAARRVTIVELRGRWVAPERIELEVSCSSGTYIRALARDLALALGTVGHLLQLVRTRVGPFTLDMAVTLETLAEQGVGAALLPPDLALAEADRTRVDADTALALQHGRPVSAAGLAAGPVWVYDPDGTVLCLARSDETWLRTSILL